MNNYQLYRTNHLLSGQLKWNLILKENGNLLEIDDLYLSPISQNIPYTINFDEHCLNYTHQENIRNFYKNNEGNFFTDGIDEKFKNYWPNNISEKFSNNDEFNNIVKGIYCVNLKPSVSDENNPFKNNIDTVEFIRNYYSCGYELRFKINNNYYLSCNFNLPGKLDFINPNENNILHGIVKCTSDYCNYNNNYEVNEPMYEFYVIIDWEKITSKNGINITEEGDFARYRAVNNVKLNNDYIENYLNNDFDFNLDYINIYEMGCKRASYKIFQKQFQFFCPLWLENISPSDEIKFILSIVKYEENIEKEISSKAFYIKNNKFAEYFFNYTNDINLNIGNDAILNANLSDNIISITGIDLNTGELKTIQDNNIISNILYRERPLIENDSILINIFETQKIIASQIFNFNFLFNLEDILTSIPEEEFNGENIRFKLDVYINNTKLDIVDFYSNYEELYKKNIEIIKNIENYSSGFNYNDTKFVPEKSIIEKNVLDYLKDNKNIDLINKNKYLQKIIHWSLIGNNDYIFNIYNNFGGIIIESDLVNDKGLLSYNINYKNNIPHLYGRSLNPSEIYSADNMYNTYSWINIIKINNTNWKEFLKGLNVSNENDLGNYARYVLSHGIPFDYGENWYNDNLYKAYTEDYNILDGNTTVTLNKDIFPGLNFVFIYTEDTIYDTNNDIIKENWGFEQGQSIQGVTSDLNDRIYIRLAIVDNINYILFLTNEIKNYNFYNFKNILKKYIQLAITEGFNTINNGTYLGCAKLLTILNNICSPKIINFNKSLFVYKYPGPDIHTTEIGYYKNNNCDPTQKYVVRYDGKIRPTFIDKNSYRKNRRYFKYNLCDKEVYFKNYIQTSYQPNYPSINYYSIGFENENYDKLILPKFIFEISHYNNGTIIYLPKILILNNIEATKLTLQEIQNHVKNELIEIFGIKGIYIYNLYDININCEFLKLENSQIVYSYDIKLELK